MSVVKWNGQKTIIKSQFICVKTKSGDPQRNAGVWYAAGSWCVRVVVCTEFGPQDCYSLTAQCWTGYITHWLTHPWDRILEPARNLPFCRRVSVSCVSKKCNSEEYLYNVIDQPMG